MDKNNKYYGIIENLVRNHRKFLGLEAILDDIIDDVYNHSKSIIGTIKDDNVIEGYLNKVVSTSIITVPKKMNYQNVHRQHIPSEYESVKAKIDAELKYEIKPKEQKTDNAAQVNVLTADVKELSNVTVDGTIIPDAYDWNDGKALGKIEAKHGYIVLGPNSTDCDFIAPQNINGTVNSNVMSKVTNCNLVTTLQEENWSTNIYNINAINSKLTADYISAISPSSENSTFKGRNISFTNYYVSGNSATVKNCKFETSDKEPYASITFPYQTKDRSEFNFAFDTCDFAKGFKFFTSYEGWKPILDKDGKLVTKAYCWYTLDENGNFPKNDDEEPQYWYNESASESDIPAANKANGKSEGSGYYDETEETYIHSKGYWIEDRPNGMTEKAYYKDFKGYLTLKNSTLDGKAITSKTDMIGEVRNGYNEKREQATKTYYVIDGVTYEVIRIENEGKYRLIEAE